MASIFEELMRANSSLTESARPRVGTRRSGKKPVNEHKMINLKNIKVESRRVFEEKDFDDLDQEFAGTPSDENPDEVVLVIDPEIPSEEEVPEDAANNMVGDLVYKCPVCGSNYVCDCESSLKGEGIEVDDSGVPTECPICGDDADQILVGEIAPAEGAGEETAPEMLDTGDNEDPEGSDDEDEFDESDEDSEEEVEEESLNEGLEDGSDDFDDCVDCDSAMELAVPEEPAGPEETPAPAVEINQSTVELVLDDKKFESLMAQIIKENYKGSPSFKITRCTSRGTQLKLEYFVREGRKVTKGVLVGEGFDRDSRKMRIKFVDKGAFTESFAKTPSFIVECVRVRNAVTPVSAKYNYKVKVNESLYRVSGKTKI